MARGGAPIWRLERRSQLNTHSRGVGWGGGDQEQLMGRQLKGEEREGRVLGQRGEQVDGGWRGPIRFGQWGMCLKLGV